MKSIEEFSDLGHEAVQLCENISELIQELPETEAAQNFGDGIEQTTLSIKKWADIDQVTEKQVQALRNMHAGLEKWVNR